MDTDRTPQAQVWPTLQAHDAPALIDFLVDVVGFRRNTVMTEEDGRVAHAQLDWPPGGGIMLGSHKPDGEWSREPGTFGGYVVAGDSGSGVGVEEIADRATRAGAMVVAPLRETGYGSRELVLADPEGNLWSVGTYRGEPRADL
ncbi:VOC family protein [Oerskovia enterophila]